MERNAIQASIFKKHILDTHPIFSGTDMPPRSTIVIEANIKSTNTKKSTRKIDEHLRHRILTTVGDANAKIGTKHIDPALCLYIGAYIMCIDNKNLKDKVPRGNGTTCRVIGFKIKNDATSYKYKNYYGKKVWTVNAVDIEWVECEHCNKTSSIIQMETQINNYKSLINQNNNENEQQNKQIQSNINKLQERLYTIIKNRQFKLKPEQCSPIISIKPYSSSNKTIKFRCQMKQIQANSNDATTGHKLQGQSKDAIIITSWPTGGLAAMFKNWEYVVLSRVRTLSGLYLIQPIDMKKSFKPSDELKKYIIRAKQKEENMLKMRKKAMSKFDWSI